MVATNVVHSIAGRVRLRIPSAKTMTFLLPALESYLARQDGIFSVRCNAHCASVTVSFDVGRWSAQRLYDLVAGMTPESLQENAPVSVGSASAGPRPSRWRTWLPLALSTAATAMGLCGEAAVPVMVPLIASSALPIFRRSWYALTKRHKLNIDVLDASATTVLALQSHWSAAAFMVWMLNVADVIRERTMARSRRAVREILDHQESLAWVLRDGKKVQVPASDIRPGETVVVYPGGRVPVDGTVISGRAIVDQRALTGESLPVSRQEGDTVYGATVIHDGKLYIQADCVHNDTRVAQIMRLIDEAEPQETRIQNYAERWGDSLVPYSFAGAGVSTLVTQNLTLAGSLLIIDYGTGIRVSAPTTVLASIARAARGGILIKGGRCLEQLAEVDALVFDKTGTLTMGALRVTDILPQVGGVCDNDILALAAAAEQRLTHPVADAVLRTAQMRGLDIPERSDSVYSIGLGVEATVDGLPVLVGSPRFMASKKVSFAPGARRDVERIASCGASPLCLAVDGNLSGIISLADSPRGEAAQVLHALRHDGIRKVVLLTGDQEAAAADMARTLGITDYVSEVFPEEKVEAVRRLKRQGYRVGVVGDGINDSPALVEGHVGIAVGWGTEVARETAQVVLVRGDLWQLPMAIRIAREAMGLVQGGWRIIWTLNSLALSLTFMGAIGPLLAATISNGSSVLAAMNGLRPLLNGHDAGGYSGNGARSVRQGP